MTEQDKIDAVLNGFVPIGNDHPRAKDFEAAVAAQIAVRPSPEPAGPDRWDRIEQKLDQVLELLQGGAT